MKFRMFDYLCEISESSKLGWNPSARGLSAHTWNINFCDFFLLISFFSWPRVQVERLNRFLYLIPRYARIDAGGCLLGVSSKKFALGTIPSPNFSEGIFNGNRKSRQTFERSMIPEKIQRPTYTKSWSNNQMVTLFPVQHAPWQTKSTFRHILPGENRLYHQNGTR
jgi:hypothetical protein